MNALQNDDICEALRLARDDLARAAGLMRFAGLADPNVAEALDRIRSASESVLLALNVARAGK